MPAVSTRGNTETDLRPFALHPVMTIATVVATGLVVLSGRYGFHRDELYFLLAGRHAAWGYVDQPPLTPLIARFSADALGENPTALRTVPALLTAATVALTALIARECGAGRGGQILAAACCACSGYVLAVGHLLSTSTFDLTVELAVVLVVLRLLRTRDSRWWPALGAAVGIALLNKQLVLALLLALLVVLLAAGPRDLARRLPPDPRLPLVAVALALLIAAPTLWWQAAHGWPELRVAHLISAGSGLTGRLLFLPQQALQFSPFLIPVAVLGARRILRDDTLGWARPVLFAHPVLCLLVLVGGGKPYYPLPLLLAITAAGCEDLARRARHRRGRTLVLAAALSTLAALPLLPASAASVTRNLDPDQGEQVGWPELARATASGWDAVPADQRSRAVLLTANYGEAGALAHYGPALGLPTPYSGHMSLADWGPPPPGTDGPVLLVHPAGRSHLERSFTGCRTLARVDNGQGVDNHEQGAEVVLCDGPHQPWPELWPQLRRY
ncbi:glycosyltransferase family 39 protein [Kitasatospora cinereorecta]